MSGERDKPNILHMLTPGPNVSPFDVNMGADAGFDICVPYTGIEPDQVGDLVQDAIFSRGPKNARRTGIFFGGRDLEQACDMLETARQAMVPPFEVSCFADPSGSFTTAAAMVASVERHLKAAHGRDLNGLTAAVFGGTGPVGIAVAVLAAQSGARVKLVSHSSLQGAQRAADLCQSRFEVSGVEAAHGGDAGKKAEILADTDVVLAAAKAGVQVVDRNDLDNTPNLLVAADVNAVPPPGIEGVDVQDDGKALDGVGKGAVGIGALAVGNIKYNVQRGLFEQMLAAEKPVYLEFRQAFDLARSVAGE